MDMAVSRTINYFASVSGSNKFNVPLVYLAEPNVNFHDDDHQKKGSIFTCSRGRQAQLTALRQPSGATSTLLKAKTKRLVQVLEKEDKVDVGGKLIM